MIIDSAESLKQCVDVIFEKAVNNESQSNFAILCTKLLFPSVPVTRDSQKMITFKEQIHEKAMAEVQNFLDFQTLEILRRINNKNDLISDEEQFESENVMENSCHTKIRDVIALFRFIAELYLVDFLPSNFIQDCVIQLLSEAFCNESCLESFCALLKISGKKLNDEQSKFDLTKVFEILEDRKISIQMNPHTRFMIEEICAVRKNRWEPVSEIDWIMLYNLFLFDVEEKLYVIELWYGK